MPDVTITDTDDTVLTLDDAVVEVLHDHHGLKFYSGDWSIRNLNRAATGLLAGASYMHRPDYVRIMNASVIDLAIGTFKVLVRKVHPYAYIEPEGDNDFCCVWWDCDECVPKLRDIPTEFQAWYAAYKSVADYDTCPGCEKPMPPDARDVELVTAHSVIAGKRVTWHKSCHILAESITHPVKYDPSGNERARRYRAGLE